MYGKTIVLAIVFLGLAAMGCTGAAQPQANSSKLQAVTSFRPFTLLVGPVAGSDAQITQLLPPGADPHDYEPTPADVTALHSAAILFYDGPFLEPWASSLADSAGNPGLKVVSFTDAVPASDFARMAAEYRDFPNTSQDPHLWLSPKLAGYFVPYAAQQLSEADPAHAQDYGANARAFEARLQALDSDYAKGLAACRTRTVLTSHAFLDYVAADYNFTAISIAGLSPDAEPSIRQMDAILNESKAAGVMGVLAEPDESLQLSQSVSSELGLPLYQFDTMEILRQGGNGSDYIAIQENNLQELRLAMGCG